MAVLRLGIALRHDVLASRVEHVHEDFVGLLHLGRAAPAQVHRHLVIRSSLRGLQAIAQQLHRPSKNAFGSGIAAARGVINKDVRSASHRDAAEPYRCTAERNPARIQQVHGYRQRLGRNAGADDNGLLVADHAAGPQRAGQQPAAKQRQPRCLHDIRVWSGPHQPHFDLGRIWRVLHRPPQQADPQRPADRGLGSQGPRGNQFEPAADQRGPSMARISGRQRLPGQAGTEAQR